MWQEITDKEQAWELLLAGLLYYGAAGEGMDRLAYPRDHWEQLGKRAWDEYWCKTVYWEPSYIRLDE